MTAKPKTKRKPIPKLEDEAQSQRFLDAAREAEAAGGLSPTEGEAEFERLLGKAVPPRRPVP